MDNDPNSEQNKLYERQYQEQTKMNCAFETIKTEVETMDFIQITFASFGASDTEPDSVYHSLLADAVNGADVEVPRTAREWELFSNMEHVEQVAAAMASHTEYVVNLIQEYLVANEQWNNFEKVSKLKDYLRDYCWRACVV
tara:strand:- start:15 stop:437 length:423 start_codon:yes stop_codon:yes gene_type:complete